MNFTEIFTRILPEELSDNVFKLVGKDYFAITSGSAEHFNAMVGSGGGLGVLFRKPMSWCVLRQDRYTLELIQQHQGYTLSYFPEDQRDKMLFLASKTGRGSAKMQESELTALATPSGSMTFLEARLVFDCRLTQITTPAIEDFYSPEAVSYIEEAYKDPTNHRRFVFGEIIDIWMKR